MEKDTTIRLVIGGRIKDLRTAQNLTQQQLADMPEWCKEAINI